MTVKFFTTTGIEFSFLFEQDIGETRARALAALKSPDKGLKKEPYGSSHEEDKAVRSMCNLIEYSVLKEAANNKKRKHWASVNAHNDECAIEVSSPIFEDWEDCRDFYRHLTNFAKNLPIQTHREDSYSGGGHVHVGINPADCFGFRLDNETLYKFFRNIFRDLNNRPYLNWIFNEYCDLNSAEPLSEMRRRSNDFMSKYVFGGNTEIFEEYYNGAHVYGERTSRDVQGRIFREFDCHKGYMCRVDSHNKTIEYRFFDMVRSEKQLAAHINFAQRYTRNMLSYTLSDKTIPLLVHTPQDLFKLAKNDRGLAEFKELLVRLKLNEKDYEPMIKMNYEERKKAKLLGKIGKW